ncbi:hypothetical protein EZJ19_00880 [Parasulfuritortus cantonensis]|uniref:Uncharacterized protein n=1 Tax=Parasulfuritortus cantonensis TaxID=2528202 RepID=A0A4R1BQX1_9PROT|nr:hypothetical protein [Parasulfuritortus cantonensis]TCJ20159.1 hypothetical protein EZJ19_00880 [Parasulfuritortus cantonensis]
MLTDKDLAEKEAGRNLGEELLEAVRQIKPIFRPDVIANALAAAPEAPAEDSDNPRTTPEDWKSATASQ